jgi:hypothetical protein
MSTCGEADGRLDRDNIGSRCRSRRYPRLFPYTARGYQMSMTAFRWHLFHSISRKPGMSLPIAPTTERLWQRKARPKSDFMIARRLVATALFARDRAAIPFDRGSHRAAVLALPWANGDAAWADTNGGV